MRKHRAALLALLVSHAVQAQQAGDSVLQMGVVFTHPIGTSAVVHTDVNPNLLASLLGVPASFDSPGTSIKAGNSTTVLLGAGYFLSDHFAFALDGGYPPRFDARGSGVVAAPGLLAQVARVDLGAAASNPIVSVREWSPAAIASWYFGAPSAHLRPHFGVGLTYVWYSGVRISSTFAQAVNSNLGSLLALAALKPGATQAMPHLSRSFAPVFNMGATYRLASQWSLGAAMSYAPLHTNATIDIRAADRTPLASSHTRVGLDPLIFSLAIIYRLPGFPFGRDTAAAP